MFVDYVTTFRRSLSRSADATGVGISGSWLSDESSSALGGGLESDDAPATAQFEYGSDTGALSEWTEPPDDQMESPLNRWLIGMAMTIPIVALNIRGVDFVRRSPECLHVFSQCRRTTTEFKSGFVLTLRCCGV